MLLVIRGTLKEAPGRELVFLEHLQLVEEDIMEIQHAVFRVSCARVLSQVFQTSKLIFSLRLPDLSNWKAFYVSQQHSLSLRFSDECYLDQDDQVTCTRCPPGYQVIETNAKEYFVIKLSYNIYSSTKNLIRWLSNNREETVENVLMDTKGTPIRPVIHVEENKVSEIH